MKNFRKFLTGKVIDFEGRIAGRFTQNCPLDRETIRDCMIFMLDCWVDDVVWEYEKADSKARHSSRNNAGVAGLPEKEAI
jgi:hypothetical protein